MPQRFAIFVVAALFAASANAGPITVTLPDGRSVQLLGITSVDDGGCKGKAALSLELHRAMKAESDPKAPDGMYVFDGAGKLLNAVALEWGCARVVGPASLARYSELTRADRLAQDMNRGQYGPQDAPPSERPAQSPALYARGEPGAVGSWMGAGSKDTETFTTTTREWRVRWRASSTSRVGGVLNVLVYNAATDDLVATISSGGIAGNRNDESYVRSAPGRYYLKIMSANCAWQVIATP